ncbi:MAG: hypothetical protein AB7T07_15575 [Steroidobacteraceae bacterium]
MSITEEELRMIVDRCNATTPGPWRSLVEGRDFTSGSSIIQTAAQDLELAGSGASTEDQDFIASAKQDIPRLAAEIAKLKGWQL